MNEAILCNDYLKMTSMSSVRLMKSSNDDGTLSTVSTGNFSPNSAINFEMTTLGT